MGKTLDRLAVELEAWEAELEAWVKANQPKAVAAKPVKRTRVQLIEAATATPAPAVYIREPAALFTDATDIVDIDLTPAYVPRVTAPPRVAKKTMRQAFLEGYRGQ